MTNQQGAPEALVLATLLDMAPETGIEPQTAEDASSELRRLHAENERLAALVEAQQPTPTPQADSQPAPLLDAREAFEAWHREVFKKKYDTGQPTRDKHNSVYDEKYGPVLQQRMWEAWQAHAARAPADSVTAPAGGVDDAVDAIALARYKVVPAHESMFHRFAVVAGDGKQQLYLGSETECQNMTRKFAGAFLDGAFYQSQIAAAPGPADGESK